MNNNLVSLVKELLADEVGHALLVKHNLVSGPFQPQVTLAQVLAVLQAVCAGAEAVCPVVQNLPTA